MKLKQPVAAAVTATVLATGAACTPQGEAKATAQVESFKQAAKDQEGIRARPVPPSSARSPVNSSKEGELERFIPNDMNLLGSARGDLNSDGREDAVIVVDPPRTGKEFLGEGPARIVILLIRDASDQLHKVKENDVLVPCTMCGGMAGDPFGYVQVKNGILTLVIEGGSPSSHWSEVYEFDYKADMTDWVLRKVERRISDRIDDREVEQTLTAANFGKVYFQGFARASLPEFVLK